MLYHIPTILLVVFIFISCSSKEHIASDYTPTDMILMQEWVDNMCSEKLGGRRAGTLGGKKAAEYILKNIPDGSYLHTLPKINGIEGMHNVVYSREGLIDSTIVIGAHFDSYGYSQGKFSPGADDNMSGVAVLMLLTHRLSEVPNFKYNIDVCFFDGEEFGRYGSKYYLDNCIDYEKIKFYINLDTCGSQCCYDIGLLYDNIDSTMICRLQKHSEVERYEIKEYSANDFTTDCESFEKYDIPYVHLGSITRPCHLHLPIDSPSILDYDQMFRLSNMLTNFILDNYEHYSF